VDVGHEAKSHSAIAVMLERLICHHRAEVGAAYADVDDVADALSGVTLQLTAADAVRKRGHLVEDGVNLRHDVFAVDDDRCPPGCTECHVQHRAIFRDVDLFAAKHRLDPGA